MEKKTTGVYITKTDDVKGIVTAIFSVFGIIDEGNDVVHAGAFAKTFVERGGKIRVLDLHRVDTISRAIGKPLSLREIPRSELPKAILDEYPDATGGAEAVVQFLMDTPEGKGAFVRIKEEVIDEWSFAYDALDYDFTTVERGGQDITIRNLRTIKLYEISPVIWGMNPATVTTSAKTEQDFEDNLAVVGDASVASSDIVDKGQAAQAPTQQATEIERKRLELRILLGTNE